MVPTVDPVTDDDAPPVRVGADDGPDQEVAGGEGGQALVDDDAHLGSGLEGGPVVVVEAARHLEQAVEGRSAGQLEEHGTVDGGDDHGVADRPAALADERVGPGARGEEHAHRAVVVHPVVEDQAVAAGAAGPRGHARPRR